MDNHLGYTFRNYMVNEDAPAAVTWRGLSNGLKKEDCVTTARNDSDAQHSRCDTPESDKPAFEPCNHYEYRPPSMERPPCWKSRGYTFDPLGFHEEILDFYQFLSPTQSERAMRKELVKNTTKIIQDKWPGVKVEVFGSCLTGLFLPTSDVDIVVFGKWQSLPLYSVQEELRKANAAIQGSLTVIDKTSVPIVKFTDKQTKVKVDICFNIPSSIQSAKQIKEYMTRYPLLPKLVLVIKQFLYQRQLNEVYTGGISSYSLILLIVSFLQRHPRIKPDCEDDNLGVLLTEFFELYGRNFNYLRVGISVKNDGYYFCKPEYGMGGSVLCILDPLSEPDRYINIAQNCFGMWNVKRAFESAYVTLSRALIGKDRPSSDKKTILSFIVSVPKELIIHRDYVNRVWGSPDAPTNHNSRLAQSAEIISSCNGSVTDKKRSCNKEALTTTAY